MVVQDDQSITKSTHTLLIRGPKIHFVILPLVLRCFKQFSKLFQPFTIGFKQLPDLFQYFFRAFQVIVQPISVCYHAFSSFVQIYFIIVGIDFRQIFLPLFRNNFKRRSRFKNALLGLDLTGYPFWMIFCEAICLTVLVLSCFFYN
jgi:hypothetical protein